MATIRGGERSVLLVVDVQNGVMADAWDAPRIVGNVARVVERARDTGVPVVWVQHNDEELLRDTEQWRLVPQLAPANDEPIVHKSFNSCFEDTTLDDELAKLGVTRIVLAGAATNWCIRATAYGALERGYDITLIEDAHTTENVDLPDGHRVEAHDIVSELNAVMKWVAYPDRTSTVVPTDDWDPT